MFCIKQNQKRKIFKGEYVFEIFLYLWEKKHARWSQKFASGVTKFWPCDEIRRFDGTVYMHIPIVSESENRNIWNKMSDFDCQTKNVFLAKKINVMHTYKAPINDLFLFLIL
jgi:hypothetical protein